MTCEQLEQFPCVREFLSLDNELDRFDYAASLALSSPGLPAEACTEQTRIPACDSGLYFRLSCQDGRILLTAQSRSLFVLGLCVMLAEVVRACPPQRLAEEEIGLAALLDRRGLIPPERRRGLAELEARVMSFAKTCP